MRSLYVEPERPAELDWPALQCRDVFKIFRSGPAETVALRGLDLRIERGEAVAAVGPSGSGKSTLLSLAAGLDEPSAGEVRAFGRPLVRLAEAELAHYRATKLALVFQSDNLWPALSARDNVAIALRLARDTDSVNDRAADALAALGLGDRLRHRPSALSGGEQQRVAIAAAAARRAPLVLCDEPTGELDERNEELVLQALLRLRSDAGSTVVVVTHSERVGAALDRVVEIRDGKARE
ncbi:MAG: ABC transporter ATP-binding protein [Thermoleophilaceae bacterium]